MGRPKKNTTDIVVKKKKDQQLKLSLTEGQFRSIHELAEDWDCTTAQVVRSWGDMAFNLADAYLEIYPYLLPALNQLIKEGKLPISSQMMTIEAFDKIKFKAYGLQRLKKKWNS